MLEQAVDFREESLALYRLLKPLDAAAYETETQFKRWTFNDILRHIHVWNVAADQSLNDQTALQAFLLQVGLALKKGDLRAFEEKWLADVSGPELLERWHDQFMDMSADFAAADPHARVRWAGPDMSVRSSITARLMETWAHGQAIYDALGVDRIEADRIRNVAMLGVNTFGWTFRNRGLPVPPEPPLVRLTAPSGDTWTWNDSATENRIEGSVTDFCLVVTQARNVADTGLRVVGETAKRWMAIAQCFAGPPVDPPAPGTRFKWGPQEE